MKKRFVSVFKKKGIETAIVSLELLKAAAGATPVPALGTATEIILCILNLAYQDQQNAEAQHELVNRCVRAHVTISQHLESVQITPVVLKHIQQFETDLRGIQDFVERDKCKNRFSLLIYSKARKEELQRLGTRVEDTLRLFQIKTLLSLQEISEHVTIRLQGIERGIVELQRVIGSVPIVEGADTSVPIVPRAHIITRDEILNGQGYRFYSAEMQGKLVAIKVFEGRNATSNWESSKALDRALMHPNLPRLIGTSSADEATPFSVYDLNVRISIESLIMSSMDVGLDETFANGVRLVYGISAALHYLSEQEIPLVVLGAENFDVFWDYHNKAVLAIHPEVDGSGALASSKDALGVMNDICLKIFRDINRILYEDDLDRSHEEVQIDPAELTSSQMHVQTNEALSPRNDMLPIPTTSVPQPRLTADRTRRELVWKISDDSDTNLKEISRQYRLLLDMQSHSRLPARRFRAINAHRTYHRCKGYSREEVTLTPIAFHNKVVIHATPSLHEVCLVCGEHILEDPSSPSLFACHCGQPDDGVSPNIQCKQCFVWQHKHCSYEQWSGPNHLCMVCQQTQTSTEPFDDHFWTTRPTELFEGLDSDMAIDEDEWNHRRSNVDSWQPELPDFYLTPPSIEPSVLVPDQGNPGLFGPRSPRLSYESLESLEPETSQVGLGLSGIEPSSPGPSVTWRD